MNPEDRIKELARLMSQLPVPNYSLLRAMSAHLIRIVQHAQVNKMTIRNVGIVFSPTLSIPAGIFSMMLADFERVFNVNGINDVDSDGGNSSVESYGEVIAPTRGKERVRRPKDRNSASAISDATRPAPRPSPSDKPSKRNSMIYANTSADKMLGLSGRKLDSQSHFD